MSYRYRRVPGIIAALFFALLSAHSIAQQAETSAAPPHLLQAAQLVEKLQGKEDNHYGGGKRHIDWDADPCSARTVCSSFTTLLLQRSYGWSDKEIKSWLGETNPMAFDYHDAIVARNRFLRVIHAKALRPGDIMAVKYTDHHVSSNGVEDTGHVMVVAEPPKAIEAKKPLVDGMRQYLVTVIDSSASGHGPKDTRHRTDGSFTGGIGRGEMRIYADDQDKIVGYTWSATAKSPYFTGPERELVAGRIKSAEGQ